MQTTGTASTVLIVLRGNSGSGKSSVARSLRDRHGRGMAWVEQDHLRRIVLRERDVPGGVNIGLIEQTVRYALDHGYHVVLEGILFSRHYGEMLRRLCHDHVGRTLFFYFDIPFEETVRRHATRPQARDFTPDDMREWYVTRDLLGFVDEQIITASETLDETLRRLERALGSKGQRIGP